MDVGVTATRDGLTRAQVYTVAEWFSERPAGRLRHGDCVGGDEELDAIARLAGWVVGIHPPIDPKLRAFCRVRPGDLIEIPMEYLPRNKAIIRASSEMLGCPKEDVQPGPARGQGTWSAIRAAGRMGVPTTIFWPDGRVEERNPSGTLEPWPVV